MEKEREHTKFIIQRFDTYISGANTKGNFLLAFNTFLCGSIITNYKNISELIADKTAILYLNINLFGLFIIGLLTTMFIIKAVYPFRKSNNSSKDKYHSLIFFESIAAYESGNSFTIDYQNQQDKDVDNDLAQQAYILSKGLTSKHKSLAWAMRFVYVELILLLTILIIITIY